VNLQWTLCDKLPKVDGNWCGRRGGSGRRRRRSFPLLCQRAATVSGNARGEQETECDYYERWPYLPYSHVMSEIQRRPSLPVFPSWEGPYQRARLGATRSAHLTFGAHDRKRDDPQEDPGNRRTWPLVHDETRNG
jgi:hypothetical protein